ncbi:stomatin-like protein 2, mitochondrial [Xenia sp. Carnegie-2017]|uniref:stomatin-like protein 2, mitochondrial n=1 Tax=Xenia sp. Carnegie-2017 TaxID=2897299 RepID=UPI001F047434|nr:stomatin-like protein 2, mitochondrial [Xenia sp. Carnegie-2017]
MFSSSIRRLSSRDIYVGKQLRFSSRYYGRKRQLPANTVINFVPQQEAWIIERFGKFSRVLDPGLAILIPFIEQIKYVQSLKEVAVEVPSQSAITLDNVTLQLDGVLYYRVEDPYQASYGVEDCEYAVTQLAQTTMRSELGKITLDKIFQERTSLNANIVNAISEAASAWGIKCLRYEIRDIQLPSKVKEAMQMQVEAERKKRAAILESEGTKVSAINVAEGQKQSQILASEGRKLEQINTATGEANAILAKANARAEAIIKIAESLSLESGNNAAALTVAEQYVQAFGNLAKTNNTVILPANAGDAASMVAQAMAVYNQVSKPTLSSEPPSDDPNDGTKNRPSYNEKDGLKDNSLESTQNENDSIKMDYNESNTEWGRMSEPSHFTVAGSPTRKRDFL